ncbi:hypothetical protein Plhal304r1_c028g0093831 [Plasmopara halstedii]
MLIAAIFADSAAGKMLPDFDPEGADEAPLQIKANFDKIDEVFFTFQKKPWGGGSLYNRWMDLHPPMVIASNGNSLNCNS